MKKGLKVGLVGLGLVVVGGLVALGSGKPSGIRITEGAKYQYQLVSPEDVVVEYSGLKPDVSLAEYGGMYVFDSAYYMDDEVGIYLGEKHFEADVEEFVPYTDIEWSWSLHGFDLYQLEKSQGSVNPEFFEGSIDYADGMVGTVKPDSVALSTDSREFELYVDVNFRGSLERFTVDIHESWGDFGNENVGATEGSGLIDSVKDVAEGNSSQSIESIAKLEGYDISGITLTNFYECDWLMDMMWENYETISESSTPKNSLKFFQREDVDSSYIADFHNEYYIKYMIDTGRLDEYRLFSDVNDFVEAYNDVKDGMEQYYVDPDILEFEEAINPEVLSNFVEVPHCYEVVNEDGTVELVETGLYSLIEVKEGVVVPEYILEK